MSGSVLIFYTKKDLLHVTMNNQSHYFRVLESVITELTNDTDLKFLTSSFTIFSSNTSCQMEQNKIAPIDTNFDSGDLRQSN